jgi:hypothetical protein
LPSFGRQNIFLRKSFLNESSSYTNFPYHNEKDPNNPGVFILNIGLKIFKVKEMVFINVYFKDDNESTYQYILNLKKYFNF